MKMTRLFTLILVLVLALSLTACGGSADTPDGGDAATPPSGAETSDLSQSEPGTSETTQTEENVLSNGDSYTIDHPLFAQAQSLSSSNGDDYTPFNLQWIDGANGLISFDVQRLDITSPPDYHEYKIVVFHNGIDFMETGVGGFVEGRTPEPTTTVTVDLNEDSGGYYKSNGAGECAFIVYAALNDEIFGQVVKSDVFVLDGSQTTPNAPSDSSDASNTPDTSTAPDTSSGPSGGTISMPSGFPSNNGDAEYFAPLTDDYIYYNNSSVNSDGEVYGRVYLTSYDASGNLVQFAAKWVYEDEEEVREGGYVDEYSMNYLTGIVIGNAVFVDYMAVDDGELENRLVYYGMPKVKSDLASIPASVRANYYVSKP